MNTPIRDAGNKLQVRGSARRSLWGNRIFRKMTESITQNRIHELNGYI